VTADPVTGPRCAVAARARRDPLTATAGTASRLLLVELAGPWGHDALRDSRLDRYLAGRLADATARAGIRVQLIRRPGRHRQSEGGAVALVDLRPGAEAVHWGTWEEPHRLLELELGGTVSPHGPQDVVLVCTHGRHDLCCALDGRPVAATLASALSPRGWDVWETTHLGGERFAANVLVLPEGDLFGRLTPDTAPAVIEDYRAGRLDPAHHRGRFGRPAVEQAALQHLAASIPEDRRGALEVVSAEPCSERWLVEVEHRPAGHRYRLVLRERWSAPERFTCAAAAPSRVRRFEVDAPPALL